MMRVYIKKGIAKGVVNAPISKSYMHRYLLGAFLSDGQTRIYCDTAQALPKDVLLTLSSSKAFNHSYQIEDGYILIYPSDVSSNEPLDCGESGSTLRFLIPSLLIKNGKANLVMSTRLQERGIGIYKELFKERGILVEEEPGSIKIKGRLEGGSYSFSGSISSQYATGLLMALPLVSSSSKLHLLPPINSKNYLDITTSILAEFGIKTIQIPDGFAIEGGQKYQAGTYSCEGDYSGTSFLEALNYLGGEVSIKGLKEDSIQGDKAYLAIFPQLERGHPVIDISNCIDLGPILFALSAIKHGAFFKGVKRLRIKESDRLSDMLSELAKIGVTYTMVDEDSVEIKPVNKEDIKDDIVFSSHNDHRLAMALSIIATSFGGYIDGAESINKSFPSFYDDLASLGIEVIKNEQ